MPSSQYPYGVEFANNFKESDQVIVLMLQELNVTGVENLINSVFHYLEEYTETYGTLPVINYIESSPWEIINEDSSSNAYETLPVIFTAQKPNDSAYASTYHTYINTNCAAIDSSIVIDPQYFPAACNEGTPVENLLCMIVNTVLAFTKPLEALIESNYIPDLIALEAFAPVRILSDKAIPR